MHSHTWHVADWHLDSLQTLAEKDKRSQSWVLRSILDRVLPFITVPADIDLLFIKTAGDDAEVEAAPMD